jgi:hypothetical protein
VSVVVYNRLNNIKTWINCWRQCNKEDTELIIVHNFYDDESELKKFKDYCDSENIRYVPCNKKGFDIGRMQDVFKERLEGFPNDWENLIWCTDDTLPMSKDFVQIFVSKLNVPGTGVACIEISPSVTMHIRTTGFAIKKETSKKITFPADPVTTKAHCYAFEHRGQRNMIFYNQIKALGLQVVQVAKAENSPLYDTGYWKRLDRQAEHEKVFGGKAGDKVVFICPIYDAYPQIISSLICQTHKNWELILIDDNPETTITKSVVDATNDKRINYIKRERKANYGHPHRQWALKELYNLCPDADYVVISNSDNYYAPVFLAYMLEGFRLNPLAKAVYCSAMVHSYIKWGILQCRLERGFLDCGGVMVKVTVACETGWNDVESHSADWAYFSDIIKQYGMKSFAVVKGCLFTHN